MTSKSSYSWPAMVAGILSESSRVVSDHSRHFLSLSVIFLLPLSSLLIASPSLLPLLSHHLQFLPSQSLLQTPLLSPPLAKTLIPAAIAAALLLPLLSAASAAVTRSANNGFYGRPVKFLPTLTSLPFPFLRLLSTFLSILLLFSAVVALVVSLCLLLLLLLSALDVDSVSVPPYKFAASIAAVTIARLGLEWCLASVVSVAESSWGFAPLRRSGELIDGMRLAVVCVWVVFGAGVGAALWGLGMWGVGKGGGFDDVVPVVVKTVLGSALIAVMLLYVLVTHAILYLYCKAVHGELIGEIVEEFASEYVTLPFDDNRVPHVVSVILR